MTKGPMQTLVLGAGLAGLSAAYHLGSRATLFEAGPGPGGECRTDYIDGYAFDHAGHLLHLRSSVIKTLVKRLLPGKLKTVTRDARIRVNGHELRYPIQANLFGLPAEEKAEGLKQYFEAIVSQDVPPRHFKDWARQTFGLKLAALFFEPYNRKLWTVDPEELTLDWMGPYVPVPDVARVVRGAFSDVPEGGGYNAAFLYPKRGGIDQLARALADRIPNPQYNARILRIHVRKKEISIAGRGRLTWQKIISSIPLPALVALLDRAPHSVLAAARKLRSNSVLVVNLGVQRKKIHDAHWLYFPEQQYSFYRVGFPGNYGNVAPRGCSTLYAEVACPAGTGWDTRKRLAKQVRHDLHKAGILRKDDRIDVEHLQYMPYAYVIFDRAYARARQTVLDYLREQNVITIGRWGHWEYSAMEDALLAGKAAGEDHQKQRRKKR